MKFLDDQDAIYFQEFILENKKDVNLSPEHSIPNTNSQNSTETSRSNINEVSEENTKVNPVRSKIKVKKFVSYDSLPSSKNKYACSECNIQCSTKQSLRRHILVKHVKEKNYVCKFCDKAFVFNFSLKAHLPIHDEIPKYVCVCGKSFALKPSYIDHIRRIHHSTTDAEFACEICKKKYRDRKTLRKHLSAVHKTITIKCSHETCNQVFSSIGLMKAHYRCHLNLQFECPDCKRTFSTKQYMNKHRKTHSGIRSYVCVECGKGYLSASHLNQHFRRAHIPDKNHQCSYCGKFFKTKEYLKSHENSHIGKKPYVCDICGYATAFSAIFVKHKKNHKRPNYNPRIRKILPKINKSDEPTQAKKDIESVVSIPQHHSEETVELEIRSSDEVSPNEIDIDDSEEKELKLGNISIFKASQAKAGSLHNLVLETIHCDENSNPEIYESLVLNNSLHDSYNKELLRKPKCSKLPIPKLKRKQRDYKESNLLKNNVVFLNNTAPSLGNSKNKEDSLISIEMETKYLSASSMHNMPEEIQDSQICNIKSTSNFDINEAIISLSPGIHGEKEEETLISGFEELQHKLSIQNENNHFIEFVVSGENEPYKNKNSESVLYSSSMVEIEGNELALTGPIVDESFCSADAENVCPICDAMFYNMRSYVTHLECDHE